MGAFSIFSGPEAPKPLGSEGKLDNVEQLAILLACSTRVADDGPMQTPVGRVDMIELWESLRPSVQVGYRLRARRLLRAWGEP